MIPLDLGPPYPHDKASVGSHGVLGGLQASSGAPPHRLIRHLPGSLVDPLVSKGLAQLQLHKFAHLVLYMVAPPNRPLHPPKGRPS